MIKLYDYIDTLTDKYVLIIKEDGDANELEVKDVKKEYQNSNINKICTEYSPSGDGSILSFVYI